MFDMLRKYFKNMNIMAKQAEEDTDLYWSFSYFILSQLPSSNKNIYLLKPGSKDINDRFYSASYLNESAFFPIICFLHVFTGCDTTSAIFFKRKNQLINLIRKIIRS